MRVFCLLLLFLGLYFYFQLVELDVLLLLELELLYNFILRIYFILVFDVGVWEFWWVDVVDVVLKCDFIMRVVLVISLLYFVYYQESLERRDFYIVQGMVLYQKVSREVMKYLSDDGQYYLLWVDKDVVVRLFLFSMLMIYFGRFCSLGSVGRFFVLIWLIVLVSLRRFYLEGGFFFINEILFFLEWMFFVMGVKLLSSVFGLRGYEIMLVLFFVYGGQRWRMYRVKM